MPGDNDSGNVLRKKCTHKNTHTHTQSVCVGGGGGEVGSGKSTAKEHKKIVSHFIILTK